MVPTTLAKTSDIGQNVKYFDFTINYDIEYSDYSNDVTTVCTIPDIQDAYDKGYAILAKLNDRATTYILPLVMSPNNYDQTIDGQGQIIFEGYWQVMFGAETRIPVANSASPEGLESVYRIILDCDTHRPDGHMWRVYWNEIAEGSGGTSDYTELTNKPSINGTTLSGNKTAEDLGLAPAGAYVKPSTGIPASDLSLNVQASLDKGPVFIRFSAESDDLEDPFDGEIELKNTPDAEEFLSRLVADVSAHDNPYYVVVEFPFFGETYFLPLKELKPNGLAIFSAPVSDNKLLSITVDETNGWSCEVITCATEDWVNQQGYLKSFTETDPTVPSWAKQSSKPAYTASEVGAVAVAQGASHAGEFVVVGSDGNITTVAMTAWQGGSY